MAYGKREEGAAGWRGPAACRAFLPGCPVRCRSWPARRIRHRPGGASEGKSLFTVLIPKGKEVFFGNCRFGNFWIYN